MRVPNTVNGVRYYGCWAGNPNGRKEDTTRCVAEISGWPSWVRGQCQRKRGYGRYGLFCKQHAKMNDEQ